MPRSLNLTRADRIGYVAGGIALIVWGLRRPNWSRAAYRMFRDKQDDCIKVVLTP